VSVFSKFVKNENGATAIEYGLIAMLVALAIIISLTSLGGTINSFYSDNAQTMCEGVGGTFTLSADGTDSCSFS